MDGKAKVVLESVNDELGRNVIVLDQFGTNITTSLKIIGHLEGELMSCMQNFVYQCIRGVYIPVIKDDLIEGFILSVNQAIDVFLFLPGNTPPVTVAEFKWLADKVNPLIDSKQKELLAKAQEDSAAADQYEELEYLSSDIFHFGLALLNFENDFDLIQILKEFEQNPKPCVFAEAVVLPEDLLKKFHDLQESVRIHGLIPKDYHLM